MADSIASYQEFAPFCILDDWNEGLRRYLSDPALRQQHVAAGGDYVRNNYMVEHAAAEWRDLFDALLSGLSDTEIGNGAARTQGRKQEASRKEANGQEGVTLLTNG